MDPILKIAASGMNAQARRVEAIANNIANVNTTAFKGTDIHFEDLLSQKLRTPRVVSYPAADTLPALQVGRGVRLAATSKLWAQGPIQETGRSLDLAIEGEGMFQVQLPDGSLGYTRDGSFTISDQGMLTTHNGYAVLPEIVIPRDAESMAISREGFVSATMTGVSEPVEIGRLEMVRFLNPAGLEAMGRNLYRETTASGEAMLGYPDDAGMGSLIQGSLEGSNVEIVREMTDLIEAQRAYELNSKSVSAADQMMERTSAMVR